MNNHLISREALIASYYKEAEYQDFLEEGDVSHLLWKCIDEAPAVDAVEVVHAKWVEWWPPKHMILTGEEVLFVCSNCTAKYDSKENMRYCPNCGARMDGE